MNFDEFVVKLINGTKSNAITWNRCSSKRFPHYYAIYETKKAIIFQLYKKYNIVILTHTATPILQPQA